MDEKPRKTSPRQKLTLLAVITILLIVIAFFMSIGNATT